MSQTRDGRVVEIYSSAGKGSYGSGYLLGDGIVLTARHVLVPSDFSSVPHNFEISVRTVDMTRRDEAPQLATLIWPTVGARLNPHTPDIAVIRLNKIDGRYKRSPALRLVGNADTADVPFASEIRVFATGYPKHTEPADKQGAAKRRDTHQISGIVQPGTGQITDTLQILQPDFGRTRDNEPLDTASDWKGFSGAALFARDLLPARDALPQLIGVVTAFNNGLDRYKFRAVRIDCLLEDSDLARILHNALGRSENTERPQPPPVHKLICLLDRKDQEKEFIAVCREASLSQVGEGDSRTISQPVRPIILLLPGAGNDGHAPMELVERLKRFTLPRTLNKPRMCLAAPALWWPSLVGRSTEQVLAELRNELWNLLGCKGTGPIEPTEYIKLWKSGTRPRIFVSDLLNRPLDHDSALVLSAWSKFWAAMVPEDRFVPIHLLLLDATRERAREWLAYEPRIQGVVIGELPELAACRNVDLENWLDEEIPSRVAPMHRRFIEELDITLRKEYIGQFFLRDFKTSVRLFVKQEADRARINI
ncbi:hypothetical protein AWB68_07614 [Caballeronia choica]|uniref:Trypsin-like peptidase domain-containing protein n=1 Tax=Caballeronia choica TaxID=326476 RepID=A0A158KXW1_9BURK|nr:serine protease [Caballeronia choica]SAL85251.1 hypothetical protein AWB68_07614 [Caballeronia choica]